MSYRVIKDTPLSNGYILKKGTVVKNLYGFSDELGEHCTVFEIPAQIKPLILEDVLINHYLEAI